MRFAFMLPLIFADGARAQTVLVVQEGLGKLVFLDARDQTKQLSIPLGEKPHEIEISPDGKTAYVSNFGLLEANKKIGAPGTTISVIDVAKRRERTRFTLPPGEGRAPHGLKLRPPKAAELFTNTEDGGDRMFVFDVKRGKVLRSFALPEATHNFIFDKTGDWLYAFTMKGEICRIHAATGAVAARVQVDSPRGIAWNSDRTQLIVGGRGEVILLDPLTLATEQKFSGLPVGQIFYPLATADAKWILAPAVLNGCLLVLDAKTGAVFKRIDTGSPLLLALSRDKKKAWVSNVLVPKGFVTPDTPGNTGGVSILNLIDWTLTPVPGIVDANGLAIAP